MGVGGQPHAPAASSEYISLNIELVSEWRIAKENEGNILGLTWGA